jgi:hypothetical protein
MNFQGNLSIFFTLYSTCDLVAIISLPAIRDNQRQVSPSRYTSRRGGKVRRIAALWLGPLAERVIWVLELTFTYSEDDDLD